MFISTLNITTLFVATFFRPFHLTYMCRDDAGENVFLSMLTDWDLDAAFMTSSDPYLRLKVNLQHFF